MSTTKILKGFKKYKTVPSMAEFDFDILVKLIRRKKCFDSNLLMLLFDNKAFNIIRSSSDYVNLYYEIKKFLIDYKIIDKDWNAI